MITVRKGANKIKCKFRMRMTMMMMMMMMIDDDDDDDLGMWASRTGVRVNE